MTFVYVLVFVMVTGGGEAALELKKYSTYEACKTAAKMASTELRELSPYSRDYYIARGTYLCFVKPA